MNGIIKFVLKNKLAVWLLTFIIVGSGLYAGTRMKMETIPDISIPVVTVMTVYPGAAPEQVTDDISIPIEKAVANLKGVKTVNSSSFANMSSVQIEYRYGIDMAEAEREVKSVIDDVTMPETAEAPKIARVSMNAFPIVALSISSDKEKIAELTATAEDVVKPKIEQIDGVSSVSLSGQHIDEVEMTYNQEKLALYDLNADDVKKMVQAQDLRLPLGLFPFEDKEQAVVVDGKLTTVKQLEDLDIPITPSEAHPEPFIKLKDIAELKMVGKVESVSRTNGKDAIALQVIKGQEANTVTVVNAVKDEVKELKKNVDGLMIDITLDQGEPIEKSIETMFSKAIFGAGFAILIILLFLRDWRSTIISVISIPLSILMAFVVLNQLDITLNMMTLGAMTVAIGRVIDDSIVVVENIYRRLKLKDEPLQGRALIRSATLEMFRPIMSSTLVTVAVFAPLVFVGGMVGELFMPFALTMTLALGASLVVAITVVPAFAHTLFKKEMQAKHDEEQPVEDEQEDDNAEVVAPVMSRNMRSRNDRSRSSGRNAKRAENKAKGRNAKNRRKKEKQSLLALAYTSALNWALDNKLITTVVSVIVLVASLFLVPQIGFSFLPEDEQKMMYLTYAPEPGEIEATTLKNVEKVEDKLMKRDDVETIQVSVGGEGNPMAGGDTNGALMFVIFDPDTKDFTDVKEEVEKEITDIKQSGTWKSQDFAMSGPSNEVSYVVYADTVPKLEKAAKQLQKVMKDSGEVKNVTSSLADRFDEFTLVVDQDKLKENGLSTAQIAMLLNPNVPKDKLTTIKKDDEDIAVIIQQATEKPKNFDELLDRTMQTPMGKEVKVRDLVKVDKSTAANKIERNSGRLSATVSATIVDDDVSKASKEIDKGIDKLKLAKGVEIEVGGVTADMNEAFFQLGMAMIAAIAIVYFILVVTFGEGLAPFAILFSLPFTVIGTLVALYIAGETISVSVLMGLLMLIGIVVTNAIVLVDRIIHMEHDGKPMREAILEAGATRLRPILMTAIATVGALIPLAIGAEGSGLISKGLGVTVIGGLISSTVLTLIIVPVVYEFISRLLGKKRNVEIEE